VLDVGHTPEAMANLVEGVAARFPDKTVTYVVGFLADKDVLAMLKILAAESQVYAAPLQNKRSFSVESIEFFNVTLAPSIAAAMKEAATSADVVCVTGSFAAVAEAKSLLSKEY
jgi:folylpolyglutamate synthase/dihydropteroate synthase